MLVSYDAFSINSLRRSLLSVVLVVMRRMQVLSRLVYGIEVSW